MLYVCVRDVRLQTIQSTRGGAGKPANGVDPSRPQQWGPDLSAIASHLCLHLERNVHTCMDKNTLPPI